MALRIPEETIENIRHQLDIVEVVSEYVQLKKQGRNYFGLCPFHGEKSPSFSVAPDKQIFHCFGCGAGGNVFTFLMDIEGFSFIEAVKHAADKVGVDLPNIQQEHTINNQSKASSVFYDAHELLQKLYHHFLVNTKEGQTALEYLKRRGFTEEAIETFRLGYAPNSWELTTTFLKKRGFPLDQMYKAGLLSRREADGQFIDRFRNRIMFPIWDHQAKTIAFGGRIIDEGEPKYLNSPESMIFNKSNTLYAFHMARPHIRKQQNAVLFEGYVDVISAWRAGIHNGVATLGTSLTEEQARILRRNVENITICYDSDNAGINAAYRAATMLSEAGCYVKVAMMPEGFDPDDYITKYGEKGFRNGVIGASLTLMSFKIQYFRRGKNLQDEGDRIRYIEEVLKEISLLPKAVERDHYLRQLADEFSLSLDALKQQQFQLYKEQRWKKDNTDAKRNNTTIRINALTKKRLLPAYHNAERLLLAHMIKDSDVSHKIQEEIGCSFNIDEHNAIALTLYGYYEEGNEPDPSHFMQRLQDQALQKTASELSMMEVNQNLSDEEVKDYIKQVLNYPKWLKIKDMEKEKQELEKQQDYIGAAQLAMEIIKMKQELK